jgi:ATP phosphoribosyltransferase regulatory subunit
VFTKLQTPKGTKDGLPDDVERSRYVEDTLSDFFELCGYREVRSPTIEFLEVLSVGVGSELVDTMFKFQDADGKLLALRAEMTAPVARIVSTGMTSASMPIRLFYISTAFRYGQSRTERGREFTQAGVELIGSNTPQADAEMLNLLIASLAKVGLKGVRVDLGHASLLKSLLKSAALEARKEESFLGLLSYRDENRLLEFMSQNNFSSKLTEAFLQLTRCRRLSEVSSVNISPEECGSADSYLRSISEVNDALTDYGVGNLVFFDLSLTRRIEYYTGIVFEASVPNLGLPLGGGGRYDDLLEKFNGFKLPATGFALEVERCLQALIAQDFDVPKKARPRILVSTKFGGEAIKTINILREAGLTALLDLYGSSEKSLLEYAAQNRVDYIVYPDSTIEKPVAFYDMRSRATSRMTIQALVKRVGGR